MIRRTAAASLFAATFLAAAGRAAAGPRDASPRLAPPLARSVVAPGQTAEIAIAGAPAGAREWEAFLSLDGGRSYPLRVTPHLPIEERSFPWTVPALPSGNARMKVRFGIGGVEREFVLEEGFSIAAGGGGALLAPDRGSAGSSPAAGEEGTIAWVDGGGGGRPRLVVPLSPSGVEPAGRWGASPRLSFPVPRRAALSPPAEPAAGSPAPLPPLAPAPEPLGRTIASLSRLNV